MAGPSLAVLGIKVENGEVVKTTAALEGMTVAGTKTEAATQRLTRRMALAEIAAREMDQELGRTGRQMALLETEARKMDQEMAAAARAMALTEIEARKLDAQLGRSGRSMALLEIEARKMDAEFGQMKRAMALAEIEARKMDAAMDKAKSGSATFGAGLRGLGTVLQALAASFVIREVIGMADAYTNLHSRLGLVTTSAANLAQVQGQLFQTSQETRTSLEANVALYSSLARSTKTLGLNQSDLIQVTKTVAESFIVSGASVSETNAAVRQLGQAFASGVLRGDEFNSIAENAPRLQQAVAASLHVTIGELRAMAAEGKVTGAVIATALLKQAQEIQEEFDRMPTTVGGAMVRVKNSLLIAVGAIDSTQHSTSGLASVLTSLAEVIPSVGDAFNTFMANTERGAINMAIAWEKFLAIMSKDRSQPFRKFWASGTGDTTGYAAAVAAQKEQESRSAQLIAELESWRSQQMFNLQSDTIGGLEGGNIGGGAARLTGAGPTKEQLAEAERLFKASIKQRADEWNHFVKEQQRTYKQTGDQTIRDFEDEQDRETAIAIQQYNEQARAAKAAYKGETDAAARVVTEQEKYHDDMRKIGLQSLDQLLTGGLRSWAAFFDSVFGLFRRLMARMEAEGKDSGALYKALGIGTAALSGGLAGFGVGQSMYSSSHGTAGNYARGALGGAAAGALAGSAFGPIGTAVGAMAGFVGGIIGVGSAAKEAAKRMADAQASLKISMQGLKALVSGDQLGVAIAQIEAEREQKRREYEDAYAGGKNEAERYRLIGEMNALENKRIALLREGYALQQQHDAEDLEARKLRAEGHTSEADALTRKNAADREIAQAIADHRSDEYIATLRYVTGLELATNAMDKAGSAALNMVQGYKPLQAIIFGAMTARSGAFTAPNALAPPILIENVLMLDGAVVARSSKKVYKAQAQQQFGDSTRWSETS